MTSALSAKGLLSSDGVDNDDVLVSFLITDGVMRPRQRLAGYNAANCVFRLTPDGLCLSADVDPQPSKG